MVIIRRMNDDSGMERQAPTSATSATETLTEVTVEFMVCIVVNLHLQCLKVNIEAQIVVGL